jgi:hypothetical protein
MPMQEIINPVGRKCCKTPILIPLCTNSLFASLNYPPDLLYNFGLLESAFDFVDSCGVQANALPVFFVLHSFILSANLIEKGACEAGD